MRLGLTMRDPCSDRFTSFWSDANTVSLILQHASTYAVFLLMLVPYNNSYPMLTPWWKTAILIKSTEKLDKKATLQYSLLLKKTYIHPKNHPQGYYLGILH